MKNKKIPHCRNRFKIQQKAYKKAKSIPQPHIHARPLSGLDTGISIKYVGIKLVIWSQISRLVWVRYDTSDEYDNWDNTFSLSLERLEKLVSDPYLLYLANKNMFKLKNWLLGRDEINELSSEVCKKRFWLARAMASTILHGHAFYILTRQSIPPIEMSSLIQHMGTWCECLYFKTLEIRTITNTQISFYANSSSLIL